MRTLDSIRHRVQLFDLLVYTVVILWALIDYICIFDQCHSKVVWFSFAFIFAMAFLIWFLDHKFLSINKMVASYVFLFWYYAPIHQYAVGKTYYTLAAPDDDIYLLGNALILIFCLCYIIAYCATMSRGKAMKESDNIKNLPEKIAFSDFSCVLVVLLNIVSIIYLQSIGKLFGFVEEDAQQTIGSLKSIVIKIVRFIPVATLMVTVYAKRRNRNSCASWLFRLMQIVNILTFAVVYFPLNGSIGRFYLFGMYFALAACLSFRIKRKSWLMLGVAVGFYLVFPAFNFFKYHTLLGIDQFRLGGFDTLSGDYDSHFMLLKTIEYTKQSGFSWGENLLAGLLWFVPRSIWRTKAEPTGQIVSNAYNAIFTNVSCPYCAELYYAFGIFGVTLGALLLGCIVAGLEKSHSDYWCGMRCITVGLILSFMRGAFLPVMSAWMSINLSFSIIYVLLKLFSSERKAIKVEEKPVECSNDTGKAGASRCA